MTQENKQLLLVSLMGYLPYDIRVADENGKERWLRLDDDELFDLLHYEISGVEPTMKPFLRPMESMTEEEKEKLKDLCDITPYCDEESGFINEFGLGMFYRDKPSIDVSAIDWLNKYHFDYRGLIPKGLALPAKEGMYDD